MSGYDASSIVVLEGLEAVRRRPAMYIGSSGPEGALHLALELIQNAVDEAMAGFATHLEVEVDAAGAVTVRDDGRGIPVDPHPSTGQPACELVLTTLHAGSKFGTGPYDAPGGLHGVGLACVNALAAELDLQIWRDGGHFQQRYARGKALGPLARLGDSPATGTAIRFAPDPLIFGEIPLPGRILTEQLAALPHLVPGLRTRFADPAGESAWAAEDGVAGLCAALAGRHPRVHPEPIVLRAQVGEVRAEVALQWTWAWAEQVKAWTNAIPNPQGGTHVEALGAALGRVVQRAAGAGEALSALDIREGLVAVIHLRMPEPEFDGQVKSALRSPEGGRAVAEAMAGLDAWLAAHPAVAEAVVGRALEAGRARNAARMAGERARWKKVDLRPDRDLYRQQFGIRSRNWHESARWLTHGELLQAHADLFELPADSVLLDVCCGSGVVGASFRGKVARIVGLDLTPEMVALSRQRLDEVVQGDVYDIPFQDNSFDAVCNREVLHLLPQPERPVSEVFRVLRPGGQFIVGQLVPYNAVDAPWFFRVIKKKQPLFFNHLTAEDMDGLLRGAGFVDLKHSEVLQWEDIDTWIDTWETPTMQRHQIRNLYRDAPAAVRAAHPFRIAANGAIEDCWRWVITSARKPG